MQEIRILELLIVILILAPLIRHLVKDLQALEGLVWFLPIALVSVTALFPAYGFRPECIPLLILVLVLNIRNIPALIALLKREHLDTIRHPTPVHTAAIISFLIISAGIALYFSPLTDTALMTEGVTAMTLQDEDRNAELFLRIYGGDGEGYRTGAGKRPLLLLVPPMIGSITAVDKVCGELEAQGFTVISYSRRKFDSPAVGEAGKKYGSPLGGQIRFLQALVMGKTFEKPNALGRTFEEERKADILFLLAYIKRELAQGPLGPATDTDTLFLAGYGTGGSALVFIGESPEFIKTNPQVKGLMVVESPLWSIYDVEERHPPKPPDEAVKWFKTLWSSVTNGFINLWPKKIVGIERIPRPGLPTLFMVSDRAIHPRHRERRYRPMAGLLKTPTLTALAAAEGAGILDYSDYPAKYPLYAAFFSGGKRPVWKNSECMAGTASLMTAFASLVLSGASRESVEARPVLEPRRRFLENIHFETSEAWNLPSFEYILFP